MRWPKPSASGRHGKGRVLHRSRSALRAHRRKKLRPEICRGQLVMNFEKDKAGGFLVQKRFIAGSLLLNFFDRPDFIAYKFEDRRATAAVPACAPGAHRRSAGPIRKKRPAHLRGRRQSHSHSSNASNGRSRKKPASSRWRPVFYGFFGSAGLALDAGGSAPWRGRRAGGFWARARHSSWRPARSARRSDG